jgi:hypothetical protein
MEAASIPASWKSATAQEIEDAMSEAVLKQIDLRRMTSAEISRRYPSIRLEHLSRLRRGEPLGFRMLASLVEATGAPVRIQVYT